MNGRLRPSPLAPLPQAGEGNLVALRAKFGWEAA